MIDLHPIGGDGRVIVRRDPDAEQSRGGIVIPIILRKHEQTGVVLAVHSGLRRPCDVKPGERVLFGKYAGTDIRWKGEIVTIMPEEELLAVLEPGARCMFCGGVRVHECTGGTFRTPGASFYEGSPDYVQVFPGLVDAEAYPAGNPRFQVLRGGVWDVAARMDVEQPGYQAKGKL